MKDIVRKLISFAGYEVKKKSPYLFTYDWIREMNISSIIDVGANQGQFAIEISSHFPNTQIYSFEPIADVYEMMKKNVSHLKVKPFKLGIGDKNEKSWINHTKYGNATSSLLEMGDNHYNNFPKYTDTVREEIEIITLDRFFENESLAKNIFLKIDVQGYEDKVLLGGQNAMKEIKVIQMETSFEEMYKGQQLFDYFYPLMKNAGFKIVGVIDMCYDKKNGKPLYCDTLFVKDI